MKIWILSDIHLEFSPGWELPSPLPEFDALVVAGDLITRAERGVKWLRERIIGKPVLYVPGNHESYSTDIDLTVEKAREAAAGSEIRILQNEIVCIDGVRFAGCTLWTNWELHADAETAMTIARDEMYDYRKIRKNNHAYRLRPIDTLHRHHESCSFLSTALSRPFTGKTVVISHHAPAPACRSHCRQPEVLEAAYRSDLRFLIDFIHPEVWVHGHIHESTDRMIGGTRLIANAKGYPHEQNPDFDPSLVIEV